MLYERAVKRPPLFSEIYMKNGLPIQFLPHTCSGSSGRGADLLGLLAVKTVLFNSFSTMFYIQHNNNSKSNTMKMNRGRVMRCTITLL